MKISKSAIGVLLSVILFSIFFAHVTNILSTNALTPSESSRKPYLKITDTPDHLIWFLQISDIHISIFQDPSRIIEFKEFCHYTVNAIKPRVVLASGDLTDAKTKDAIGSQQYEDEWKNYRDIINNNRLKEKTLWLDIRGNHDNFNVAGVNSKQNYFTNYSVQGKQHPRSYMYQVAQGSDLYSFIGVDACLEPGPRRPFNFVGMLDDLEVHEIETLVKRVQRSNSNYSIWFGHFPTSCILTPGKEDVRHLIGRDENGLVYVCGHLHKLGGLVPKMYTLQKDGFLELELGDWKENRVYRLLAVDHGMLSFSDVSHREWPVVLITNPKHALFINPHRENLHNIKMSTHIRILAFSPSKIEWVKVRINSKEWMLCKNVKDPLYVAKWNPNLYFSGVHNIEVHVRDIDGRENILSQPFSLKESSLSFGILSRIALMTDASNMFRLMFLVLLFTSTVPLCLLRYFHKLISAGRIARPRLKGNCLKATLRKLWILSTIDRLVWPIVFYPVYLSFGPWSVGYLVEDHIGVIFAWGIFVNGSYLPGSFTYAYGFLQILTFQIPLIFIIAHAVDQRYQTLILKPGKKHSLIKKVGLHLPYFVIFSIQVIMAYLFWLAYGTLAFILGPLRTWSLILAVFLYWQAVYLPEKCTRKAAELWHIKAETNLSQTDMSLESIRK